MKQINFSIYLDMDDVVADWMGYARAYLNQPDWQNGEMLPDHTWHKLRSDHRMFSKLSVKDGAHELVEWCTRYKMNNPSVGLYFLSAIPHGNDMPWAVQDKVFWGHKYFPHIPVFLGPFSHQKYMHCKSGDILIDDRRSNIEEWDRAGGRGHIYTDWKNCKEWLEKTLDT